MTPYDLLAHLSAQCVDTHSESDFYVPVFAQFLRTYSIRYLLPRETLGTQKGHLAPCFGTIDRGTHRRHRRGDRHDGIIGRRLHTLKSPMPDLANMFVTHARQGADPAIP